MKVSDYVAHFLDKQGVTHVFELVGGMIVHLLDALHQHGKINIVSMHHEQAASFAADAFGRLTGVPGVAMGTSGPGATNLLTGIGSCYFDSSPAVFITGQVNRNEQKGERPIRQLGFQETDIVSMARPITKAAWQVQNPEDVPQILREAFAMALEGRPGPVLIDIPMDVQRAEIEANLDEIERVIPPKVAMTFNIETFFAALAQAEHPLILAGGGIHAAQAVQELREFARMLNVPVINSLMAVDVLPYDDPLRLGLIGSYGNRWNNMAIMQSDLMLVLGSRLDIRQTGVQTDEFKGERTIFHVDCAETEINQRVLGCVSVVADVKDFLQAALLAGKGRPFKAYPQWLETLNHLRQEWPDTAELPDITGINPNVLMHQISQASQAAGAYVVDVGQHQMWAAQSIETAAHQHFMTSGGMGSMGFSLPAAIGAAFVLPAPVVVIAGDGGFQINIQELQTIKRNQLPIKMVIINNKTHGMVRQFQQSYMDERYQSTLWGYDAPDFAKVALAYGIEARSVEEASEVDAALEWLWQDPQAPALLEIKVDTYTNSYPKLAFGRSIDQMEPFYKPIAIEGT